MLSRVLIALSLISCTRNPDPGNGNATLRSPDSSMPFASTGTATAIVPARSGNEISDDSEMCPTDAGVSRGATDLCAEAKVCARDEECAIDNVCRCGCCIQETAARSPAASDSSPVSPSGHEFHKL